MKKDYKNKIPLFKVFMPSGTSKALEETLNSGYLSEGQKAAEFTRKVSEFICNPLTVTMNSCTMAINIAYRLSDVGIGDEVITTPLTSVASNAPILSLGAKPIWCDVEKRTGMIDPSKIEELITEKTKAIMVLHKEGDLAKMDEICQIAQDNNIKVIEDAAHAFGAKYKGRNVGGISDFTCFSFQAIKHITCADGGALSCKNEEDFSRAKKMKWFGVDKAAKGKENPWLKDVPEWGYKGDLNDVLATIGIEQMKHVDRVIEAYHNNGNLYQKLLEDTYGMTNIKREDGCYSTYWAYTILAENRDGLARKLKERGIDAMQIHPRNDIWSMFNDSKCNLPGVDEFSKRELSIPCGWWLEQEDVYNVSNIIKEGW
jgi:dTDP-4-amino-4,6-dideoxygalactose transaminase